MRIGHRSQRTQNIITFSKKKINYDKKIREFYLEDGIAYISCNVKNYYDIIDHYSVQGYEWLNSDFAHYIDDNANNIPVEYPILLEICGCSFTEEEQETIERTIKQYYLMKLGEAQDEFDAMRHNWHRLLIGSIAFFLVDVATYEIWNIWGTNAFLQAIPDVVQVVFWFFLWTAADFIFLQIPDAREQKTYSAQLSSVQIVFKKKFLDEPVDEATKEQIIEEVFHTTLEEYDEDDEFLEDDEDEEDEEDDKL